MRLTWNSKMPFNEGYIVICCKCGKNKPYDDKHFYLKTGHRCKICDRERKNDNWFKILAKRYNTTVEDISERYNRPCEICGKKLERTSKKYSPMQLDHNHTTGKLRGTLCQKCNGLVGFIETSRDVLNNMVEYIHKYTK